MLLLLHFPWGCVHFMSDERLVIYIELLNFQCIALLQQILLNTISNLYLKYTVEEICLFLEHYPYPIWEIKYRITKIRNINFISIIFILSIFLHYCLWKQGPERIGFHLEVIASWNGKFSRTINNLVKSSTLFS